MGAVIQHGSDERWENVENPVVALVLLLLLLLQINADPLDIVCSALTLTLETLDDLLMVLSVHSQPGPPPPLGILYHRLPNSEVVTDRREFKVKGEMTNELVP